MTAWMLNDASGLTPSFFPLIRRGLITMFCRGGHWALIWFEGSREVEIAEEGGSMPIKLISFLRSFGTWDPWSNSTSHWTPNFNHIHSESHSISQTVSASLSHAVWRDNTGCWCWKDELFSSLGSSLLHHSITQHASCASITSALVFIGALWKLSVQRLWNGEERFLAKSFN